MKVKSSEILSTALDLITSGKHQYACAAIQDAETTIRFEVKEEVSSNAMQIFSKFMPARVNPQIKLYSQWWEKGSVERIAALQKAIETAKKRND